MIYIGLCGFDSRALYEPGIKTQDKLQIYSAIYSTVEINSTFYNIPTVKTVENWYLSVPPDFRFSIKLNRLFSHDARLILNEEVKDKLVRFVDHTASLKEKLSWYLLQLPPSLAVNWVALDEFLAFLRDTMQAAGVEAGIAVEYRHNSWYEAKSLDILQKHAASQVISSSPHKWPCVWIKQAKANYIRLHGLAKMYYSAYSEEDLEKLFDWIKDSGAHRSFIYFDNTASSAGKENSQRLMQLFGLAVPEQTAQLRMDWPE